ncbi:MAG: NAD+ kinase [Deltaproteobacteria bacterium]|nr:NAD+ kinase [Deltaproteobacteria bacterium]
MASLDKIVLVTRHTRLQDLIERFNTRAQARFTIERAGGNFADYEQEDDVYRRSLDTLLHTLDLGLKLQVVDRGFVPTFLFTPEDLVITLGQDGLVANTAKYALGRPIVAVNPDPGRFDGILLPFLPDKARGAIEAVLGGRAQVREVTLAEASLSDGQRMLAFNDLFIGAQSHVSARYRLTFAERAEAQSSSGVLVSTGAGSTGWMSSVFTMAAGVAALIGGSPNLHPLRLDWEDPRLLFAVREPFVSRHSSAGVVAGMLEQGQALELESLMPSGGVIFSDGVEADFVQFNSGVMARVKAAEQRARLVVGTDKALASSSRRA